MKKGIATILIAAACIAAWFVSRAPEPLPAPPPSAPPVEARTRAAIAPSPEQASMERALTEARHLVVDARAPGIVFATLQPEHRFTAGFGVDGRTRRIPLTELFKPRRIR